MDNLVMLIAKCHDLYDGSGSLMVDLPSDLLEIMNLIVGDALSTDPFNRGVALNPIYDEDTVC